MGFNLGGRRMLGCLSGQNFSRKVSTITITVKSTGAFKLRLHPRRNSRKSWAGRHTVLMRWAGGQSFICIHFTHCYVALRRFSAEQSDLDMWFSVFSGYMQSIIRSNDSQRAHLIWQFSSASKGRFYLLSISPIFFRVLLFKKRERHRERTISITFSLVLAKVRSVT